VSPKVNTRGGLVEGLGKAGRACAEVLCLGYDGGAGSKHGLSFGRVGHGLEVPRIELSGEAVAGELSEFLAGPPGASLARRLP